MWFQTRAWNKVLYTKNYAKNADSGKTGEGSIFYLI